AQLFGLRPRHDDDRGGAVGDLRRRPGGDRAVRGERRAQLGQAGRGGALPHALVVGHGERVTAALWHRDGDDLVVEQPVLAGGDGPLVALRGVGVLVLAGDLLLLAVVVGRVAHGAQVE